MTLVVRIRSFTLETSGRIWYLQRTFHRLFSKEKDLSFFVYLLFITGNFR